MLRQISLKNFKSFQRASIRLGAFSLVIGQNGAGKSNLFDALRLLHFLGEGSSVRDAIEGHAAPGGLTAGVPGIRGGSRRLTYLDSDSPVFELSVEILTPKQGLIKYSIKIDAQNYRVVAESLTSSHHPGPYVFHTHPDVSPPEQNPDSPAIHARFYKRTRGTKPRREFSAHESILSQFKGRSAESLINENVALAARQELSAIQPLELQPEVLRQYSSLGQFEIGEHGENFAAMVWLLKRTSTLSPPGHDDKEGDHEYRRNAARTLDVIQDWLSELTPHSVREIEVEEAPTGEVIFALREEPFEEPLTARSLSDGTLRFAALSFAVLAMRGRKSLLIEELENGINPARLALLMRMLEQATEHRGGIQIIASTHAPGILDFAGERVMNDSVLIYWDEERSCSQARRLSDIPGIDQARQTTSMGELQAEGWFHLAAGA